MFLFLSILILFAVIAYGKFEEKSQSTKICKLHKWTYDLQGLLFCTQCKRRPGEIPTSYDKPY